MDLISISIPVIVYNILLFVVIPLDLTVDKDNRVSTKKIFAWTFIYFIVAVFLIYLGFQSSGFFFISLFPTIMRLAPALITRYDDNFKPGEVPKLFFSLSFIFLLLWYIYVAPWSPWGRSLETITVFLFFIAFIIFFGCGMQLYTGFIQHAGGGRGTVTVKVSKEEREAQKAAGEKFLSGFALLTASGLFLLTKTIQSLFIPVLIIFLIISSFISYRSYQKKNISRILSTFSFFAVFLLFRFIPYPIYVVLSFAFLVIGILLLASHLDIQN